MLLCLQQLLTVYRMKSFRAAQIGPQWYLLATSCRVPFCLSRPKTAPDGVCRDLTPVTGFVVRRRDGNRTCGGCELSYKVRSPCHLKKEVLVSSRSRLQTITRDRRELLMHWPRGFWVQSEHPNLRIPFLRDQGPGFGTVDLYSNSVTVIITSHSHSSARLLPATAEESHLI
jgi:hypothetical protein